MSNTIDWGQGSKNNDIGWGQGAATNIINWGKSQKTSWAGETNIVGVDGLAPVNTVAPTISGTATIGQTLTSTTGTWTSDTGVTGYLYQWYRGVTLITGATNNTYVLALADVGFNISCKVAASDIDGGTSAYVSSSNSIFLYDADYKAVLDRGIALGYTLPSLEQRLKQNQLVMDLKEIRVWSKLDVYYNFANNGSKEFATLNWKSPSTRQITMINSISWNSIGFIGNGTSTYLDTNFQLASGSNYTQNNASRYLYMSSTSGGGVFDGNSAAASNSFRTSNSIAQRINQSTTALPIAFNFNLQNEMKSIHRTSATNITLFNSTVSENRTVTSAVITAVNHLILRSATSYGSHRISMYAVGSSLVTENTDFIIAYDNYLSS